LLLSGHVIFQDVENKLVGYVLVLNSHQAGLLKDVRIGFTLQGKQSVAGFIELFRMALLFENQLYQEIKRF
jgi:hypothetical protein